MQKDRAIPHHERKALDALVKAGREIIAHMPYNDLTEKVQIMVAENLNKVLHKEYNVVSLVAQVRELLRAHNPSVTFFQWKAFNVTTEREELQKDCTLHDTEDHAIATALGVSLGEFYSKLTPVPRSSNY